MNRPSQAINGYSYGTPTGAKAGRKKNKLAERDVTGHQSHLLLIQFNKDQL